MPNLHTNTPDEEDFEELLKDIALHEKYFDEIQETIDAFRIGGIKKQWGAQLKEFIGDERKKFMATYEQEAKTATKIHPATLSRLISGNLPKKISTLMPLILFVIKYKNLSEKQIYYWLNSLKQIYGKEGVEKIFLDVNLSKKGFRMRPVVKTSPWAKDEDFISPFEDPDVRLVVVYGSAGCGKTQIAAQIAQRIESSYHFGVFWLAGKDLNLNDAIQYLVNATPELVGVPDTPAQAAEQWKLWAKNIPQNALVILDEVSTDVMKFFVKMNTPTLDLLITTSDRDQVEKIFSDMLYEREIYFVSCFLHAIDRKAFSEHISRFAQSYQDWLLEVAALSDYHPEIVSKAYKVILNLNVEDLAISPHLKNIPTVNLEFHLFARNILRNLTESQKELILAFADAASSGKVYSIEEVSAIWHMEPDPALFILKRFLSLDLVFAKSTDKVYVRKYRPHGVLVEACKIARKFNRDPEEFLLASDELF